MKRFHVHVAVDDLASSIRFYSAIFNTSPAVVHEDYAKWMLDDPRVNFAISTRSTRTGVDHLGIQVDSAEELDALRDLAAGAQMSVFEQRGAACCYAQSDKYWIKDPQGIAWETFHTLSAIPVFGADTKRSAEAGTDPACCAAPVTVPIATLKRAAQSKCC